MTVITYRDGVSIGEVVFYSPALIIAILLSIRHGFGRSSGWLYLIIFSLIRIVGAAFQLATINQPTNISLYTGVAILQNIGISPLELTALGLLSRVVSSINKSLPTFVRPQHLRLIQIIVIVGLILGIVGGTSASGELTKTGVYEPQTTSKVGIGLFLLSFLLLSLATAFTSFSISYAEPGEKRLLLAVALALPFILVRLIYSSISTFANPSSFNTITGNVTILLCMALIMEAIVVVIFESIGLSLRQIPRQQLRSADYAEGHPREPLNNTTGPRQGQIPKRVAVDHTRPTRRQGGGGQGPQILHTLGRRTLIGRIITSALGDRNDDIEMQRSRY